MPPPVSSSSHAANLSRLRDDLQLEADPPTHTLADDAFYDPPGPRWLDGASYLVHDHDDSDDYIIEEEEEDEDEDHELDEAMPDIRGSFFDPSSAHNALADAAANTQQSRASRDASLLAGRLSLASQISAIERRYNSAEQGPQQQQQPLRQPYSDADSFVHGDHTWPSSENWSARAPLPLHTQTESYRTGAAHSLRRTAGLSSTLRRAQPRARQPLPVAANDGLRPRSASPGTGAGSSGQIAEMSGPNAARTEEDLYNAEYTGWAPGTSTSEHQRPTLNTLRAMARGHRPAVEDVQSSEAQASPERTTAMSQLERRYWAEQERQRRQQAIGAAEQTAARRWDRAARSSIWSPPNNVPVDINGNPIDAEANGQLPSPRSIIYNRPAEQRSAQRADVYDLHRDLEEMRDEVNGVTALNRRARREMQRARRTQPDEIRRDELRRGLYDLHRDRHADAPVSNESTRRNLEEGIKYLGRLRDCETPEEAYRAAEEDGLIVDGRSACDLADFIFDSKVVEKTPWTSWLLPGTRFSGFQHAVTVSALPSYTAANTSAHSQPLRIRHPIDYMHASRIPTATASSNPNSSTYRPSWIESVMQRDRHAGATQNHGPRDSRGSPPSSIPSSLLNPSILASPTSSASQSHSHVRQENEDTWPVKVTITSIDYEKCTLTGTMEAMNVPNKQNPANSSLHNSPNDTSNNRIDQTTITTFLEGEIIDLNTHSLETRGFNADSVVDSTYWRRLEPFKTLGDKEVASKLVSSKWLRSKIGQEWVLMRWKGKRRGHAAMGSPVANSIAEKCFVTPSDAGMGLTISGFYYISLQRSTGKIEGLYYDPQSSPYQHLCLEPTRARQFSTYKFQ